MQIKIKKNFKNHLINLLNLIYSAINCLYHLNYIIFSFISIKHNNAIKSFNNLTISLLCIESNIIINIL